MLDVLFAVLCKTEGQRKGEAKESVEESEGKWVSGERERLEGKKELAR